MVREFTMMIKIIIMPLREIFVTNEIEIIVWIRIEIAKVLKSLKIKSRRRSFYILLEILKKSKKKT
jgi:hypothetical protein